MITIEDVHSFSRLCETLGLGGMPTQPITLLLWHAQQAATRQDVQDALEYIEAARSVGNMLQYLPRFTDTQADARNALLRDLAELHGQYMRLKFPHLYAGQP